MRHKYQKLLLPLRGIPTHQATKEIPVIFYTMLYTRLAIM